MPFFSIKNNAFFLKMLYNIKIVDVKQYFKETD